MAARFARALVLVTEADHFLAAAAASRLAREGASLVLPHRGSALSTERVNALASKLAAAGTDAIAICADLTDHTSAHAILRAIAELGPRVHAVVHTPIQGGVNLSAEARMSCDVSSLMAASRLSTPLMDAGGAIISLMSLSARDGGASGGDVPSVVASGAALAVVRGLARDLGPRGIRVNAILCDLERFSYSTEPSRDAPDAMEAEAVAGAAAFMLSAEASYITGTDLRVSKFRR
jgi:3-oxoacyl-[acyl-carrier protein] reductase